MQEAYRFERLEDFRNLIGVRYRLLPYLYSEYMKAALSDDLYFKPMAFVYPQDPIARETEDQLIIGNEIMVAPVYTQNAKGRVVYFPEEMRMVKFCADGSIAEDVFGQGYHYVETKRHCLSARADVSPLARRRNVWNSWIKPALRCMAGKARRIRCMMMTAFPRIGIWRKTAQ